MAFLPPAPALPTLSGETRSPPPRRIRGGCRGADLSAELTRTAAYFRDGKAHTSEFVQTFTPSGFTKSRGRPEA